MMKRQGPSPIAIFKGVTLVSLLVTLLFLLMSGAAEGMPKVDEVDALCRYTDAIPSAMHCWDVHGEGLEFTVQFKVVNGVKI